MRKIVVSQFLTLDGVMESPETWTSGYLNDKEVTTRIMEDFAASDSLLFGRTTFEFFASRWPTRTGEMADMFNHLPKHVASTTLQKADWKNSTLLHHNAIEEIQKMKGQSGKNILVFGSYQLVQVLMKENLIGAYTLYTYPLTLGKGKRLFAEETRRQTLQLVCAQPFSSGVVASIYVPERK